MVHVMTTLGSSPFGIVFQKLDIEFVKPSRRPDIEGTFANLLDGSDPGSRAAAKRPDNEFRGANLERRSIQRIERLGVRVTDALGGDARLRGGSRRSKPLTQSNASNLAVASWPVDPVTSATRYRPVPA
jgi:hypothetical protein